ncbi:MAG TPA: AI-2E family transporter [Chroococcales cyanobacterium]|jgi:hypothetical protein
MLEHRLSGLQVLLAGHGIDLKNALADSLPTASSSLATFLGFIASFFAQGFSLFFFLFILLVILLDYASLGEVKAQYGIQTLSNALSSVALTLEFFFFRIDLALFWGILTFFLAFIPEFGLMLASIPPIILAFVQHGPLTACLILGIGIILNGVMDNFVTPRFTGKGLFLRLPTIVFSAILWLWIFGPLGAFLAVPLTLMVRAILESDEKTRIVAYAMSTADYEGPG